MLFAATLLNFDSDPALHAYRIATYSGIKFEFYNHKHQLQVGAGLEWNVLQTRATKLQTHHHIQTTDGSGDRDGRTGSSPQRLERMVMPCQSFKRAQAFQIRHGVL